MIIDFVDLFLVWIKICNIGVSVFIIVIGNIVYRW